MANDTVIFAGPSLEASDIRQFSELSFRPPIEEGDVLGLLDQGVGRIGIIDGYFGDRRAVSHKEILLALSLGIPVYGASSMGALRAAELDSYGMVGIGEIYRGYRSGKLTDDGDVAVAHGPADLGYMATSVPLVEVAATLDAFVERRLLSRHVADHLRQIAADQYFGDRTWSSIAEAAFRSADEAVATAKMLREGRVQLKRLDALQLLNHLSHAPLDNAFKGCPTPPFTTTFRADLKKARASSTPKS